MSGSNRWCPTCGRVKADEYVASEADDDHVDEAEDMGKVFIHLFIWIDKCKDAMYFFPVI